METNTILDFICLITVIVIFVTQAIQFKGKQKTIQYKILCALEIGIMVIFVLDLLGWHINGRRFYGDIAFSYVINTLYWMAQITYSWLWLMFAWYVVLKSKMPFIRTALYTIPIVVAEVVILIVNLFTHWVFYITEANVYTRGDFYTHNLITFFIYIFAAVILSITVTLTTKNNMHKKKCATLILYAIIPIAGVLIQSFYYGLSLIWPFCTIDLLMIFISSQQEELARTQLNEAKEKEKRVELENEIVEQNVKIMLSQIQPHFLYNCLTTIAQLCDIDPKTAKQATLDFSKYLRANIDSLSETNCIPLETELEHVKKYLSLEKLRFEDYLNVVYDIKAKGFMVPPLSIQPIVENAVKYGVCQKESGGTIVIATMEEDDNYVVSIKDDGVGFSMERVKNDGKPHVGIENVRSRVERLCDGSVVVESHIGVGTEVRISIPKGE